MEFGEEKDVLVFIKLLGELFFPFAFCFVIFVEGTSVVRVAFVGVVGEGIVCFKFFECFGIYCVGCEDLFFIKEVVVNDMIPGQIV